MWHVKIDLVPWGEEQARSTFHDVYVVNDGTGTSSVGHYEIYVDGDPRVAIDLEPDARLQNVPRNNAQTHCLDLMARALQSLAASRQEATLR